MISLADEIQFSWDNANIAHLAVHGITPAEAEQVFYNGYVEIDEDVEDGEERSGIVGISNTGRVLTIWWTPREKAIRPITGWDATKAEELAYWAGRGD